MKKSVLIEWTKEYFIRESKELPDTTRLHTQLYEGDTFPFWDGATQIGTCLLID